MEHYSKNPERAKDHGEGGLYSISKSSAVPVNEKHQAQYEIKARKEFDKLNWKFSSEKECRETKSKAREVVLKELGDTLHIAQDRGSHGEGAIGWGHDNTNINCDDPDENRIGYEEAQKNTEEVLSRASDFLYYIFENVCRWTLYSGPAEFRKISKGKVKEATRVAERVMRMSELQVQRQTEENKEELIQPKPLADQITPLVQRQVKEEEEKKKEEEEILQTKENPGQTSEVTPDLESHIQSLRGCGQPLPESIRAFFEPRFGHDFSQVRIHTDARAAESAQALNARAFTAGRDVIFGAGQYVPETNSGKKLLAHELTHMVQQNYIRVMGRLDSQPVAAKNLHKDPSRIMSTLTNNISRQRTSFSLSPQIVEQQRKSIHTLISPINLILQRQEETKEKKSKSTKTEVLEFNREKGVPSELGAKVLDIIEGQIENGIDVPEECVKASFVRIEEAYTELGGTRFPPHGAIEVFEVIWNSATKSKYWKDKFHKQLKPYKGKGAAGAIFYAGLGYIVPWKKIWTDLQPGAVLQLWKNYSAYKDVRDKREVSRRGHSVIFVRYVEKGTTPLRRTDGTTEHGHEAGMLIVEQYGEDIVEKNTGRQVARSNLRWRYAVGANFYPLKKPPSDEASPLE